MAQQPPEKSSYPGRQSGKRLADGFRSLPAGVRWGLGIFVIFILVPYIASYFLDEPLRSSMEKKMNSHLKGYSVRLPRLHLQLVGFSMALEGLTVIQKAHPDPPIALFPVLHASINWSGILSGSLVAEFDLERPEIHVNLRQLSHEAQSKVPLKKQGWQQAVEEIYPLKINILTIHDGTLSYIDQDPARPLRLNRLELKAENIRNVRLPDKVYPSSIHLETVIFGTGRGVIEGKANFLAEPYPGIKGRFSLDKVPLDFFAPVITRASLSIRKGLFSAVGEVEYAPNAKNARIDDMTIKGMDVDYRHTAHSAAAEEERAEKVGKAARELGKSAMEVRLDRLRLSDCTVGMVNEAAGHPYRVFLSAADLLLTNLSNRAAQGSAEARLTGKFMGSGVTSVTGHFRPDAKGPDLDLNVSIKDTRLTDMNDLLRAYGNFDVSAGYFSLYSELRIKNENISGYVKPFFRDLKVYDKRKDREKTLFHKMYEMMVGGVARLLESSKTGEVATKAEISGKVEKPEISTWQIFGRLIKNAFFKKILPGFEKEATGQGRR